MRDDNDADYISRSSSRNKFLIRTEKARLVVLKKQKNIQHNVSSSVNSFKLNTSQFLFFLIQHNVSSSANCFKLNTSLICMQVPGQRPISASNPRPKPVYGRKQFNNAMNNPSSGAPKAVFGSYAQAYGTISSSQLASIQGRKS